MPPCIHSNKSKCKQELRGFSICICSIINFSVPWFRFPSSTFLVWHHQQIISIDCMILYGYTVVTVRYVDCAFNLQVSGTPFPDEKLCASAQQRLHQKFMSFSDMIFCQGAFKRTWKRAVFSLQLIPQCLPFLTLIFLSIAALVQFPFQKLSGKDTFNRKVDPSLWLLLFCLSIFFFPSPYALTDWDQS